jgi:hypothetical protein
MSSLNRGLGILIGVSAGLLLHGGANWWSQTAFAQAGPGGITFSISTLRTTLFESPPACTTIGSSRVVDTLGVRVTNTIGPSCIGIGEISVPNASPACGAIPPDPVLSPLFGTTFIVTAGNRNTDVTNRSDTYQCVAAVPAMPWTFSIGLAGLLLSGGAWWVWKRTGHHRGAPGRI